MYWGILLKHQQHMLNVCCHNLCLIPLSIDKQPQIKFAFQPLSYLKIETKILNSANTSLEIEKQAFRDLSVSILKYANYITSIAEFLSEIDISVCFSELAKIESWVKPKIDTSLDFEIVGGRHPVVEHALKKEGKAFYFK